METCTKNIKKICNIVINTNFINKNSTIQCDDGNGPYERNYGNLIEELKKEYIPQQNSFIHESRPNYVLIKLQINGFDCQISFGGSHYCGYVVDKQTHKISEDDIDYEAHGGWTAGWGFDCAHCTDIAFLGSLDFCSTQKHIKFPYDPPKGMGLRSNSTFKTKKFVIHELGKITESIIRYQNQKDQNISCQFQE